MHESQHVKLLGHYATPQFRIGDVVECEMRGHVRIASVSRGRIAWPRCRVGKARGLIVYGDLATAIRRESAKAVMYWWSVGADRVWKWRQALGVAGVNEGTSALLSRLAPETVQSEKANRRRAPALKSRERAEKIAAAKRGKPRPAHVIAALVRSHKGKPIPVAQRRKMSESHKRRGTRPAAAGVPWTDADEALLGKMPDVDVVKRTGRTLEAVRSRRYVRGIPRLKNK